jgi:hypothetical protein
MMMSCKNAADLICESLDRKLNWGEAMRLRLHLLMCRHCRAFARQNQMILRSIDQRFDEGGDEPRLEPEVDQMAQDACERIKRRLREQAHEPQGSESGNGNQ